MGARTKSRIRTVSETSVGRLVALASGFEGDREAPPIRARARVLDAPRCGARLGGCVSQSEMSSTEGAILVKLITFSRVMVAMVAVSAAIVASANPTVASVKAGT